jgi:uncharacterized protein
MATGILLGVLVGRRGWVERLPALREPIRRAHLAALGVALLAGALSLAFSALGATGLDTLAKSLGRPALMAFYALSVLRLLAWPGAARWLRPFALAGRMPLSNYPAADAARPRRLLRLGPGLLESRSRRRSKVALATGLYFLVQLPLSAAWLARFRYGPVEYVWRRSPYGRLAG